MDETAILYLPPGFNLEIRTDPPEPEPIPVPSGPIGLNRCLVIEPLDGGPAALTVVHLHGNGQTPTSALGYVKIADYPSNIRWVVPAGPVLSGSDWRWWEGSQNDAAEVRFARDFLEPILRELRERVEGPIVVSAFSAGAGAAFALTEIADLAELVDGIHTVSGRFVHIQPACLPIPIKVWNGELDTLVPPADVATTIAALEGAGFVVDAVEVEGMAHAIEEDVRVALREQILSFDPNYTPPEPDPE